MLVQKITQLLLVLSLLGSIPLSAQSTTADSVSLALNDYIDAFYYGDTSKIHRSIE